MSSRRAHPRLVSMGNQDANVQGEWSSVQSIVCMKRAGCKPASLQQGELSGLLRNVMSQGRLHGVSQKKENRCISRRVSYLQPNSAALSGLIKPFTAVADEAQRDSYIFWLGSSNRSPGNNLSVMPSESQQGDGLGQQLLCHPCLSQLTLCNLTISLQKNFSLWNFAAIPHRAQAEVSSLEKFLFMFTLQCARKWKL